MERYFTTRATRKLRILPVCSEYSSFLIQSENPKVVISVICSRASKEAPGLRSLSIEIEGSGQSDCKCSNTTCASIHWMAARAAFEYL